jgi:hypothetical protein
MKSLMELANYTFQMGHIIMVVLLMDMLKVKVDSYIKLVVSTKDKFGITLPKAKEYLLMMFKNTNTWERG